MKKKVISILLALFFVLGLLTTFKTPVQAAAASWQDAYADYLKDRNLLENLGAIGSDYGHGADFCLYDVDKNGIPELFVLSRYDGAWYAFTFDNDVKLFDSDSRSWIYIPNNQKLPGYFVTGGTGAQYSAVTYCTLKNNKCENVQVWQSGLKYDEIKKEYVDETYNNIYDAKLKAEFDNSYSLPRHYVNNFNIVDIIYNYGKPQPTNPHPYVTALRDYFKDAKGSTAAYLEDINGDGIKEMLAYKSTKADGTEDYRLFYIFNGNLLTYDKVSYRKMMLFSKNNHLVTFYYFSSVAKAYQILAIKNGKVTESTNFGLDYETDGPYFQKNTKISKSEYEELLNKYGVSDKDLFIPGTYQINRPDQSAQILVMTTGNNATIPTPNAIPTSSTIYVNGKTIAFDAYTIDGYNYFKLRDLAMAVNSTSKNFEVIWDGSKNAINLVSNHRYTVAGGELSKGDGQPKTGKLCTSTIYKDGIEVSFSAYTINGYNYFKLRDIAQAFNIGVTYNGKTNTIGIDTFIDYIVP